MPLVTTRPADVSINLLPTDIRTEQNTQRRFSLALAGAIGLLVVLGLVTIFVRMQISSNEHTLHAAEAQAASLRTQVSALHEYEAMKASIDSTKSLLGTVLQNDVSWTRFLDDLDTHMPADSWLQGITVSAKPGVTALGDPSLGTANYTAYVTSMPGLANWLDTMSGVKGLQFVYLSNGTKTDLGGKKVVSFTATADLTDAMLSKRCQGEGSQCP